MSIIHLSLDLLPPPPPLSLLESHKLGQSFSISQKSNKENFLVVIVQPKLANLSGKLGNRETHRSELLGGDGAISVLVEEGEGLLELGDLLLGQLVSLGGHKVSSGRRIGGQKGLLTLTFMWGMEKKIGNFCYEWSEAFLPPMITTTGLLVNQNFKGEMNVGADWHSYIKMKQYKTREVKSHGTFH